MLVRIEATGLQPDEFTTLLRQCTSGDKEALDVLTPVIYQELKRLAVACMRQERPGVTLQPTALVHEAYLRLVARICRTSRIARTSSEWRRGSCGRS